MIKVRDIKLAHVAAVVFLIWNLIALSGCSVFMAARQPDYKDLKVLDRGAPRSRVIAELGAPILTEERDGRKVDIFSFKQGYGKGNKVARTLFHAAADVWTLGLWEVVGTPVETIASGKKMKIEVTYDENDRVEKMDYIDKNYVLKGGRPSAIAQTPSGEKEHSETEAAQNRVAAAETPQEGQPVTESKVATYSEYYRLLYKTISHAVVKPDGAARGTVSASFTLLSDGSLEDVQILESSTEDTALRNVVDTAIRSSAPFPPFPDDIKAEGRRAFTVTLEFKN